MLAGRKLLLADDSITIQKVVELTFVDEGVNVLCVANGREAIEWIENFAPDVVLADIFMPELSGYEVCEFVKQNEKLKHIPVMLLVGSFEPYDEAEARRVGADDTLTKPFQSIRRLVEKVDLLLSGAQVRGVQPEAEAPTAELPRAEEEPEPEQLSDEQIEITTADTRPLPPDLGHDTLEWALPAVTDDGELPSYDAKVDERKMESNLTETPGKVSLAYHGEAELLDLGDFEPGPSDLIDEYLLDIDRDEAPEVEAILSEAPTAALVSPAQDHERAGDGQNSFQVEGDQEMATPTTDQLATTQEFLIPGFAAPQESVFEDALPDGRIVEEQAQPVASAPEAAGVSGFSLEKLSPEVIDAIARRVVEHLSEKVVQEIAWEVVPQLAELLIKRQLEEKSS